MKTCIFLLLTLLSSVAFADNCDKPRDDFDGLYCLNKVYSEADNELNLKYKELKSLLKNNEKKKLAAGQNEWIRFRNDNCSYKDQKGFWVNLNCTKETTVERTNFLNDRIRECKATGCQPSNL
jgi:uncharacterized protein YecT (DUF1311 family)